MTFPVYLHLFGYRLHPHPVMEAIAYTGGFQLYLRQRRIELGASPDAVPAEQGLWLIVGAVFGALLGSKSLAWIESWPDYLGAFRNGAADGLFAMIGGKTIVGGVLGGWAGVEIAKRLMHIHRSTGDAYVIPLAIGISIGRIGCFLTGLSDHTCGSHSSLPWAVDFGDGPRHPTQLYDIVFLLLLATVLVWLHRRHPAAPGAMFRQFVLAYCLYRFAVEFIKPTYRLYARMSAIQLACFLGAAVAGYALWLKRHVTAVSTLSGEAA